MAAAKSTSANGAPHILAMVGSMRTASFNRKLLHQAVQSLQTAGAQVNQLELRDLELPLYDGDLEEAEGLPPGAERLKAAIAEADGMLIVSPEYNHSIPGPLKNAIDWASRGQEKVFNGKTALLMGASTSPFGASRALNHLRQVLNPLGVWVVPGQVAIPHAASAFDENGGLVNDAVRTQIDQLVGRLIEHAG